MSKAVGYVLFVLFVSCCTLMPFRGVSDWPIVGRWISAAFGVWLLLLWWTAACLVAARGDSAGRTAVNIIAAWRPMSWAMLSCNVALVAYGLLQCAGLFASAGPFAVTAGFDNPAGLASALAVTFPFASVPWRESGDSRTACRLPVPLTFLLLLFVADAFVLYVAGSRAGIIALAAGLAALRPLSSCGKRVRVAVAAILSPALMAALVLMFARKGASTSGRSLILRCSWDLFVQHPLTGHGFGGFRRCYMSHQASWLAQPGNGSLSQLADNVNHPLCEYMAVLVNHGVAGLAILLTALALTLRHALRHPTAAGRVPLAVISAIAVMSLFSYPFRYPLTLAALAFSVMGIYSDSAVRVGRRAAGFLTASAALAATLAAVLLLYPWLKAQMEWKRVLDRTDTEHVTVDVLSAYDRLEPELRRDPYFQYSRALVLLCAGHVEEAKQAAEASLSRLDNYDTWLLAGDIERSLGNVRVADSIYVHAGAMCPSRFMPLYRRFTLYQDTGDAERIREVGGEILSKPMKVNSAEVRRMRLAVRQTMAGMM